MFLLKWRAMVEVRFLRCCVAGHCGPNAPKEPLDADAQAEADGGDDEAPLDVESDDGSIAGSSYGGSSPHSSQASPGASRHLPGRERLSAAERLSASSAGGGVRG